MRKSILRSSLLPVLLVVVTAAPTLTEAPTPTPGDEDARDGDFRHPLDLTDDLYHRIRAGLFVPECEPLVIRASTHEEHGEQAHAVGQQYFRFDGHLGRFDVRTSATGVIVVHADREAILSHLRIWSPTMHHEMAREFLHYPSHPIQ